MLRWSILILLATLYSLMLSHASVSIAETANQIHHSIQKDSFEVDCYGLGTTKFYGDANLKGVFKRDGANSFKGELFVDAYYTNVRAYKDNFSFKTFSPYSNQNREIVSVKIFPDDGRSTAAFTEGELFERTISRRPSVLQKQGDAFNFLSTCSLQWLD